MPLSQEYHIGTRSFRQHVDVTLGTVLLPVALALAHRVNLPERPPWLALWIAGTSLAVGCWVWGGYRVAWEGEPATRWGRWMQAVAAEVYPPLLLFWRYLLFAFCFLLAWDAAKAVGFQANLWMEISLYAKLALHPLHRLLTDILPSTRRKGRAVATALVRMLNLNATISLCLALLSATAIGDSVRTGENLVLAVLVLVPVALTVISSVILFLDYLIRFEAHTRRK
jgi:hypothetical protein